jgi:hypothetical protein
LELVISLEIGACILEIIYTTRICIYLGLADFPPEAAKIFSHFLSGSHPQDGCQSKSV